MEIKVQCACGAKFSFDVEPVEGQMPEGIICPKCGADATNGANAAIAQKLSGATSTQRPSAYSPPPKAKLKVSGGHERPTAASSAAAEASASGVVPCSKHHNNLAEARCTNCDKPICMECMSIFGYFCSIGCRYQAEQKGIPIPKCPHQKVVKEALWWRKAASASGAVALVIVGLIAADVWFYFYGS